MVLALCLLRLSGGSGVALWAQASRHDGYADIGIAPLLRRAALLARHGYGALLLDTRGHGCSGGQAGKIAVLGESMGGKQALAAAGSDPRIHAVVAEGTEGQQYADRDWRPHDITGVSDRGMEWGHHTPAGLLSGAPRPMSIRDAIRARC